jgi:hypothetical protein
MGLAFQDQTLGFFKVAAEPFDQPGFFDLARSERSENNGAFHVIGF